MAIKAASKRAGLESVQASAVAHGCLQKIPAVENPRIWLWTECVESLPVLSQLLFFISVGARTSGT